MTPYYNAADNAITVGIADFMNELGSNTSGLTPQDYAMFRKTIKDLSDYSIIGVGFNGKDRIIRLINSAEFPKRGDRQIVTCYMSDDFREAMKLQDKGNTKIEFKIICSMTSRFTIKLYNVLRSWQGKEKVIFSLEYLKDLLNATAKSYASYGKFKQAVLDVAVNEINEKTTLQISYEPIGKSNGKRAKIEKVAFYIKKKTDETKEPIHSELSLQNKSDQEQPTSRTLLDALEEINERIEALKSAGLLKGADLTYFNSLIRSCNKKDLPHKNEEAGAYQIQKRLYEQTSSQENPILSDDFEPHPIDELEAKKEKYMYNPSELHFSSPAKKEKYIDEYISQLPLNEFCKTVLLDIVPEDVHLYNVDHLNAIEAILKVHIPLKDDFGVHINWLRDDQQKRMKNALMIYTTKNWSRYKYKTKTTPFQHYTSNLGYWLQENKNLYQ